MLINYIVMFWPALKCELEIKQIDGFDGNTVNISTQVHIAHICKIIKLG